MQFANTTHRCTYYIPKLIRYANAHKIYRSIRHANTIYQHDSPMHILHTHINKTRQCNLPSRITNVHIANIIPSTQKHFSVTWDRIRTNTTLLGHGELLLQVEKRAANIKNVVANRPKFIRQYLLSI